jgi:hypothetical protein
MQTVKRYWSRLVARANREVLRDSLIMLGLGVVNNVAISMTAFAMPGFPSFNNYFTALASAILFGTIGYLKGEEIFTGRSRTWAVQKQYMLLGLITTFNWLTYTFTNTWVDGNLQQVLASLIFVFVYIFSVIILKLHISMREVVASLVILIGVFIGFVPALRTMVTTDSIAPDSDGTGHPSWFNSWYFVSGFVLALMLQGLFAVCQERVLRPPFNLQEASCLCWLSMYLFLPCVLMIPLEGIAQINALPDSQPPQWAWSNQAAAFRCLAGVPRDDEYPAQCASRHAFVWIALFLFGYAGYFYYSNVLYRRTNSFWTTLLQTLTQPLAAIVFNYPQVVGSENSVPFSAYTAVSFVIIILGVLMRGTPDSTRNQSEVVYQPLQLQRLDRHANGKNDNAYDSDEDDEDDGLNRIDLDEDNEDQRRFLMQGLYTA